MESRSSTGPADPGGNGRAGNHLGRTPGMSGSFQTSGKKIGEKGKNRWFLFGMKFLLKPDLIPGLNQPKPGFDH